MSLSYSDNDDIVLKDPDGVPIGTPTNPMHVTNTVGVVPQTGDYPTFSVGQEINMASSSVENPLLLIRNPSGSGKLIVVWQVYLGVNVTNTAGLFRITSNPTVSVEGTTTTPVQRSVGVVSPAAVALTTLLPTITVAGGSLQVLAYGQNSPTVPAIPDFSVYVHPDNSVLIWGRPTSNNRVATVTVVWAEVTL